MANILFFFKLTITYLELKPRVLHSIYYITCKKKTELQKSFLYKVGKNLSMVHLVL